MNISEGEQKLVRWLAGLSLLIFVVLPFHALLTTWAGSNFGHLDLIRIWKEILIFVMAFPAVWLATRSSGLKSWFQNSWIVRLIAAYTILNLGLGAWALAAHHVNRVALIYALIINLRFLGFFLVCVVVGFYSNWIARNWLKVLLWPSAAVVLFGLAQRLLLPFDFLKHFGYGPKTIPAYQTVDANLDYRRVQSTLRGANPLGAYMSLIISGVVFVKRPLLRGLAFIAASAVLFLSYSRSAWIGTALALSFLGWQLLARRVRWHYLALICTAVAILAAAGLYFFGAQKSVQETLLHYSSTSTAPKSSNSERAHAIKTAAKDVLHQPLGRGPGTAGPASFRNDHPPRIAENYYLQLAQETGIAGALIFIAINCLVALELFKRRAEPLAAVLLASLVGISFINLLSHAWADDTLSLLWWGMAGIALTPVIVASRKNGRIQKKS